MKTESIPHPKWLRTYMLAHRVVSWTVEQSGRIFSATIAGLPVLDSAIGNGFIAGQCSEENIFVLLMANCFLGDIIIFNEI